MTEVVEEFAVVALHNCGLGEQIEDTEIVDICVLNRKYSFKLSIMTLCMILY